MPPRVPADPVLIERSHDDATTGSNIELLSADRCAQGVQGVPQGGGRVAGNLPVRLVLVIDLHELVVLLLHLLGILAGRPEEQLLELVEHVLAGLLAHLPGYRAGLKVTDQGSGCRGDGRELAGTPGGVARRVARLARRTAGAVSVADGDGSDR